MDAPRAVRVYVPALLALFLPLLSIPSFVTAPWSARYAVVIVVAVVAIPMLWATWASGDRRAAVAAASFLGIAALSTVVAHVPDMSLVGNFGWGTGLVFLFAMVGFWCVGRLCGTDGRGLVAAALVAGAVVNSVLGLLAYHVDLTSFHIGLDGGRTFGLLGNPVYFAAVLAAAFWPLGLTPGGSPRRFPSCSPRGSRRAVPGWRCSPSLSAARTRCYAGGVAGRSSPRSQSPVCCSVLP